MATIRQATIADADALGRVHVDAWQQAYRGIMPDSYLDELDPEQRAWMWRDRLRRVDADREVLVAVDAGAVVGFALLGRVWGAGEATGEIYALNLTPAAWGRGIGSQLLQRAEEALRTQGHERIMLWVATANDRARRFYERHGWAETPQRRTEEVLGAVIDEVAYTRELTV